MTATVTITEKVEGEWTTRTIPVTDISDRYYYSVTITTRPDDWDSDDNYNLIVERGSTGIGLPLSVEDRDDMIEAVMVELKLGREKRVHAFGPRQMTYESIPVTFDSVTVHDETGLGITAADVIWSEAVAADREEIVDRATEVAENTVWTQAEAEVVKAYAGRDRTLREVAVELDRAPGTVRSL